MHVLRDPLEKGFSARPGRERWISNILANTDLANFGEVFPINNFRQIAVTALCALARTCVSLPAIQATATCPRLCPRLPFYVEPPFGELLAAGWRFLLVQSQTRTLVARKNLRICCTRHHLSTAYFDRGWGSFFSVKKSVPVI